MSGTWDDLDRELHRMFLLAHEQHRTVDRADIRTVIAQWIGIPEPRLHSDTPDTLVAAVVDDLPHCTGGNCRHAEH